MLKIVLNRLCSLMVYLLFTDFYAVLLFSGFFSGCSITLIVAIVLRIEALNLMDKEKGALYLVYIFPLYRQPYTPLHLSLLIL